MPFFSFFLVKTTLVQNWCSSHREALWPLSVFLAPNSQTCSSTYRGFCMKLPLISGSRSTNTQCLHNLNWIEVKLSYHTAAAVRCIGRHFQICAHAQFLSHSETTNYFIWSESKTSAQQASLVHGLAWPMQVVDQRAIHNAFDKYIGKTLLIVTVIPCTAQFSAFVLL